MNYKESFEAPLKVEDFIPKRVLRFDVTEIEENGVTKYRYLEIELPVFVWDYPHVVSAIIRAKYSADEVEAILLNRGDGDAEHDAQYEELQAWRKHAKEVARSVITAR